MPASRSRTERWKDCLHQIYERSGTLEISLPRPGQRAEPEAGSIGEGANLVWRVKILALSEGEVLVEAPATLGRTIPLASGVALIGAMTIGQNRWMFHTRVLGPGECASRDHPIRALRISMPQGVERCSRRSGFRISTAALSLARVEAWPLLDPSSVAAPEAANRALVRDLASGARTPIPSADSILLPEVGPLFQARLMNLGGGGVGLLIDRADAQAVDRARAYWLRIDLRPEIPAPIAASAKLAHTHIDSEQNVYAGLAFDFTFNPAHREFIVEQVCRYASILQASQTRAAA